MAMSLKRDGMGSPEASPSNSSAVSIVANQAMRETLQGDPLDTGEAVLYQASFFLCTVKVAGDIPGGGPIYVEIAVDRDSGISFAKVYSTPNPVNGVDILASRVLPYFCKQGFPIREIRTRKTHEYCGLTPRHAYATFLASSHIEHALLEGADDPCYYLCEQFYWFLVRKFFQPALRTTFGISLARLQKDLDRFLELFNSGKRLHRSYARPAASL